MSALAHAARVDDPAAWLRAFVASPTFLVKYPLYAAILSRLEPVLDPSVDRIAVSLHDTRFFLHVNADALTAEPQYLTGLLLHEVHHVALGHLANARLREVTDRDAMELAMEMSANEFIEEPLPNPIRWESFAAFGIRARQSTMERYEILSAARRANAMIPREGGTRVDDHRTWAESPAGGAIEHTRALIASAMDAVTDEPPTMLRTRPQLAGRDAGDLIEELVGVLRPPDVVLDWRAALRRFAVRLRAPVHTYGRPNRRFPTRVGVIPGRIWSPRLVAKPSILVAIDTSMSMTREELAEVARQLVVLQRHARITITECDTTIARVYPFAGSLQDIAGRGGTDLRPVFSREFLATVRVDGIIYFTDGAGPTEAEVPAIATLWVLTKPAEFECSWGARASMVRASEPVVAKRKPARRRRSAQ